MTAKTKNAEEPTGVATLKELRARDAALAMREYQREKLEILARTERLRALRLSRDSQASQHVQQPAATRKKAVKRKS